MGYKFTEVVALSRMVKVGEFKTNKLLRMAFPVMKSHGYLAVVTYSDSSLGHTGNVYKLSGFTKGPDTQSPIYVDANGNRTSPSKNGKKDHSAIFAGHRTLTRWTKIL